MRGDANASGEWGEERGRVQGKDREVGGLGGRLAGSVGGNIRGFSWWFGGWDGLGS